MKSKHKFKQTEIGNIPENWEIKNLEEVAEIIDCLHSKKPNKQEKGFIYLEVFNLDSSIASIKNENLTYISEEDYNFWIKRTKPDYGDLVITNTGIVATAMIPENFQCCIGRNMTLIKPNKKILNPEYLRFYSLSRLFKQEMKNFSLSGTILESLHVKFMGKLKIALPPYDEQLKIVNSIKFFFDKGDINQQMNKTLEAIGQALFRHWFIDFEFPNEKGKPYKSSGGKMIDSELGKIPKGWRVSTIGEELKTVLGGTPSTTNKSFWENGDIAWINSGKINEVRITEPTAYITKKALENSATKLLPKGTTVLAITGATLGQVSRIEIDTCANQSVIGVIESEALSSEYVYYWVTNNISKIIRSQTGGAQQHVNKDNVNKSEILIPSEGIIRNFNKIIKPVFNQISVSCFESKNLSQIRDSLLPKLMSGKIRVPVEVRNG